MAQRDEKPGSELVRAALERLTASEVLVRSDRLCRFLRFVVERTLEGRGQELKEYLVGVEVLGKGPDFDPRLDSAVRVDARRLRTKLDEYYAGAGAADNVRIALPKGQYVPLFEWAEPLHAQATVQAPAKAAAPAKALRAARLPNAVLAPVIVLALAAAGWSLWRRSAADRTTPANRELETLVTQASSLVQRRTEASLLRAIEYADRSVAGQPGYAPAYVVLADAWLALADHRHGAEHAEAVRKARGNAEKAIQLNGSLAGPLTTLGSIAMDYEWQWREAEQLFQRAIRVNPKHGLARARYARLLSLQGRHREALDQARNAEALTPVSVTAIASVAHVLFYARDYEQAVVQLRKALEIDPAYDNGRLTLAKLLGFLDRYDEAWEVAGRISPGAQSTPEACAMRAFLLGRQGRLEEGRAQASLALKASSISRATAWCALGDHDAAFRVLEEAVRTREQNVVYVKVTPGIDPLRSDARIETICRETGLTGCMAPR